MLKKKSQSLLKASVKNISDSINFVYADIIVSFPLKTFIVAAKAWHAYDILIYLLISTQKKRHFEHL